MSIRKPMLAASMEHSNGTPATFKDLAYPLGASIKLDGIRCVRANGQTLSRSFKQIPNKYIQAQMANLPNGLDGELVTYNIDGTCRTFNQVQGDVMREEGEPNFLFEIFDYVEDDLNKPYLLRMIDLQAVSPTLPVFCTLVLPTRIKNEAELLAFEEKAIADGHEGIMTRNYDGKYKAGRATFKSQDLIKVKRMADSEAVITGLVEKLNNENEATKDELGHTKRSSAKSGMVPAGTLGTFNVRDLYSGVEFDIGTGIGLNDELRQLIWDNPAEYVGKTIKYQYQKVGTKDKPRIPSFQGFRHERDM